MSETNQQSRSIDKYQCFREQRILENGNWRNLNVIELARVEEAIAECRATDRLRDDECICRECPVHPS